MKTIFLIIAIAAAMIAQAPQPSPQQTVGIPSSGPGSGTVTSIATTSPIMGGTISSTGTIACPTCLVSAGPLIFEGISLTNATYPAVRAYGITSSTDTDIYSAPGASSPAAISGCTNASPTVCTFASGNFSTSAGAFPVTITGATGNWTAINGGSVVITPTGATTASIAVNATSFGALAGSPVYVGKRVLLEIGGGSNIGSTSVSVYFELKTGGTYYRLSTTGSAVSASGNIGPTALEIVLEPGESISVNTSGSAGFSVNLTCTAVQFDVTSGLKTAKQAGTSGSNTNYTIYTAPAGKTARIAGIAGTTWNAGSALIVAVGANVTGNSQGCVVASGGTLTCSSLSANSIQINWASTANNRSNTSVSAGINLSNGDSLVIQVATGDAAQIFWVNLLEL